MISYDDHIVAWIVQVVVLVIIVMIAMITVVTVSNFEANLNYNTIISSNGSMITCIMTGIPVITQAKQAQDDSTQY